jgi:hypothetical protein
MAIMHLGMQSVPKTAVAATGIAVGTTPIHVTGAGFTPVNQKYDWSEANTRWQYSTSYKIYHDGTKWLLSNVSLAVDYYSNTGGDANTLPTTGWTTEAGGSEPAPTISA